MTDDEIEATIDRCGAGKPILIEAAFQPYLLWLNMALQCGLTSAEAPLARAYIRAFYNADGTSRHRLGDVLARREGVRNGPSGN